MRLLQNTRPALAAQARADCPTTAMSKAASVSLATVLAPNNQTTKQEKK